MVRIAVIGDSHIMSSGLPNNCLLNIIKVTKFDLLIHVGDLSNEQVLNDLKALGEVIAVAGESDSIPLPDKEVLNIDGLRLLVIHGHQKEARLHLRRLINYFNAKLVLMGHTHRYMVQDLGNALIVNPGTFTGINGSRESMAIVDIVNGVIKVKIQGCGWSSDYAYGGLIRRADELMSNGTNGA